MSQFYYYNADKVESGNKRIRYLISAIVHALLLLLLLWRVLDLTKVPDEEIGVEILLPIQLELEQPEVATGGGSSPGPESEAAQEGGSPGSEAPPTLEEVEKVPDKIETSKPIPVPVTPSPKPVIISVPEPQVVKVDPPKVESPQPSTKPSTDVITKPTETKPNTNTGGAHGNTGNSSSGDNDDPGSGTSGTGTGTGSGSGGANTGNGTGGGGGAGNGTGTGSGDGVGVDFDEVGPLKRQPIYRPIEAIKELARDNVQIVAFNMCINREGLVTYIKYNAKLSKTKDLNFIKKATTIMQQYKFQVNPKAPKKECGTFTFNAAGMIQRLK